MREKIEPYEYSGQRIAEELLTPWIRKEHALYQAISERLDAAAQGRLRRRSDFPIGENDPVNVAIAYAHEPEVEGVIENDDSTLKIEIRLSEVRSRLNDNQRA